MTIAVLAGCSKMAEAPLTFATATPRIEVPTLVKGEAMATVTLPAASGGSGEASYTLTPKVPGLQFEAATRVLSGTPTEAGTHRMTYTATDGDGEATTLSFTIAVVDGLSFGAQTVAAKSFAQGAVIEPLVLPPAAGGTGDLTYSLEPPVPGLTFAPDTRVLSGMPTTADTYAMTYEVTDAAAATASLNFTISVLGFALEPIPNLPVLPDLAYEVDTAITALSLPAATGGDGELVYSLDPPVPGLSFDGATRTLSGTPTKDGVYPVTYEVTDAQGTVVALSFDVTVIPSFRGTWRWRSPDGWWDNEDDDEGNPIVGYFVDTLTFTRERFIMRRAHYRADGTLVYFWADSGTWELSGDRTIVRVVEDDHDDDDATPRIIRRIPKSYRWADDMRTGLYMPEWDSDEADDQLLYERVPNPLPTPPTGTWTLVGYSHWWAAPDAETMSIDPGGTFTYSGEVELAATWTLDEENYYLNLSVVRLSGGRDEDGDPVSVARVAYAPTDQPNEILMSGYYPELDLSYGDYYQLWRQQ